MGQPTNPPPTEGQIAREVFSDFVEDANESQFDAIKRAAKRAIASPKAAPLRELVRDLDNANGGLLSRALGALTNKDRSHK